MSSSSAFLGLVDRLGALAQSLNVQAASSSESSSSALNKKSNYADAILLKPITDYVRDAELVESRLFQVSQDSSSGGGMEKTVTGEQKSTIDLKRKETGSATPLRKAREAPLTLLEPEEYLRSVLRITDKYDTMPRARAYAQELLDKIETLRKSIPELERTLKELNSVTRGNNSAIKTKTRTLREEERLTRETEARVAVLREQRASLLKRLNPPETSELPSASDDSVFLSPSAFRAIPSISASLLASTGSQAGPPPPQPRQQNPATKYSAAELRERRMARQLGRNNNTMPPPKTPASAPSEEEDAFWSVPPPSSSSGGVFENMGSSMEESLTTESSPGTRHGTTESEAEGDNTMEEETDNDEGEGDVTIKLAPATATAAAAAAAAPQRRTFSLLRSSTNARPSVVPVVEDRTMREEAEVEPASPPARSVTPPPAAEPEPEPEPEDEIPPHEVEVEEEEPPVAPEPEPEEEEEIEVDISIPGSSLEFKFARTSAVDRQLLNAWKTVGYGSLVTESALDAGKPVPPDIILQALTIFAAQPVTPTSDAARASLQHSLTSLLTPYFATPTSHITLLSTTTPTIIQVLSAALILQLFSSAYAGSYVVDQRKLKESLRAHPWVGAEALAREVGNDPVSKVVYSVMGRKLIKVDRRENSVRFVD